MTLHKKRKNNFYFLTFILLLFILLGCSNSQSKFHKPTKIDRQRIDGSFIDTLYIVDDSTYAPYIFNLRHNDGKNEATGIMVDIWKLWSQKTGIPIKFTLTTFSNAIREVESKRADVVSGIMPKYREGLYQLIYSKQYYSVEARPIIKRENEVYYKDLTSGNYKFGTCRGDVINLIIKNDRRFNTIDTIGFNSYSDEINALVNGKISGILIEEPIFKYTLFTNNNSNKINDFVILPDRIDEQIHAGATDPNVIKLIDLGFQEISNDDIQSIQNAWVKRYEPNIFLILGNQFIMWFKVHIALGIFLLFLCLILITNAIAYTLYLFSPSKLILIEPYLRNLPIINIKYQSLELSFSKLLFLDFFFFNNRTINSFYENSRKQSKIRTLSFLNKRKSENYLTLPVSIGEENVGYIPLVDNLGSIKTKLKQATSLSDSLAISILGSGGVGKSTFAHQICDWLYSDADFNSIKLVVIPIDFYWVSEGITQDVFDEKTNKQIVSVFFQILNTTSIQKLYNYFYEKNLILIVVDGFSEYATFKKDKIATFLNQWRKSGNHIIITTRSNEYKKLIGAYTEVRPQLLRTAFLINLIEHTVINIKDLSDLSQTSAKRVSEIFNLLNRLTNDDGVTPLFCKMFTEVLYNSSTIDLSEQNPIGIYKYYETIFYRYLSEILSKNEGISKEKLESTVDELFKFATFFAWRQTSIHNSFDLNNYLSLEDLSDYQNSEYYLKLLSSPGSVVIENQGKYKYKFDPIAEILISKFLYEKFWSLINKDVVLFENELQLLLTNKHQDEILMILNNLKNYTTDQIRFLNNDNRSQRLLDRILAILESTK